jgi:hypothetical protein
MKPQDSSAKKQDGPGIGPSDKAVQVQQPLDTSPGPASQTSVETSGPVESVEGSRAQEATSQ